MLLPVNIYCESALNAASQTHRFASCWSTCTSEKSVVFQTRAVWSADVVTKSLDKKHDFYLILNQILYNFITLLYIIIYNYIIIYYI